jgi:hypothetical protein
MAFTFGLPLSQVVPVLPVLSPPSSTCGGLTEEAIFESAEGGIVTEPTAKGGVYEDLLGGPLGTPSETGESGQIVGEYVVVIAKWSEKTNTSF